ncbi:hypothetical protein EYF80_058195 [Liparis tanakae]|uniref:Uncharacterized protein n=1 Tax=Liparis tanakae TaxID=230148 RepID=A0A4Z2ERU8_9TELE|nr:hypothetical protein EYF80_058195 [Liparis tanakae]
MSRSAMNRLGSLWYGHDAEVGSSGPIFQVLHAVVKKLVPGLHGFNGRFDRSEPFRVRSHVSVSVSRWLKEIPPPRSAR